MAAESRGGWSAGCATASRERQCVSVCDEMAKRLKSPMLYRDAWSAPTRLRKFLTLQKSSEEFGRGCSRAKRTASAHRKTHTKRQAKTLAPKTRISVHGMW